MLLLSETASTKPNPSLCIIGTIIEDFFAKKGLNSGFPLISQRSQTDILLSLMGCRFSKSPVVVSSIDVDVKARREETYQLLAELRSLLIASWPPPDLILEESGHHRISHAIAGKLREAISKNPGLLSLLNDHLNYSIIKPLVSLAGVKGYLDKARIILSAVHVALEFFEEENAQRNDKKKKNNNNKKKKKKCTKKYSKAVDRLMELRALRNPFEGRNINELRSACEQQQSLLALLRQRNHELEKRLKSVKKWRKAWNVIYMAGVVAVLACSVMLAAMASPAAAVAGATASATAMKCVEPCIDSLWEKWERSLQGDKDIIAAMQRKGGIAMRQLENIRLIVEKLKIDTDVMLKTVDFAISKEDGEEIEVEIGIEKITAKKEEFEKIIDGLKESLDSSDGEIRKATTEFLEIIMKDI